MRAMMMTMIAPMMAMITWSRNALPVLSLRLSCRARKPPTTEPIRPAISQPMMPPAAADDEAGDEPRDQADDDPGDDRFGLIAHVRFPIPAARDRLAGVSTEL